MAETLVRGCRQRPDHLVLRACPRGTVLVRLVVSFSTLLGPEGTSFACCFGRRSHLVTQTAGWPVCVLRGGVGWLFVEMCIVDASILFLCVGKFLRADGGCLGTRSR